MAEQYSDSVVFSQGALSRIQRECRRAGTLETGGILVGSRVLDHARRILVVAEATGPGMRADRRHLTYAPDHTALSDQLEWLRDTYASIGLVIDYLGEWHKHPAGYRQPSAGDLEQAQLILASPEYRLPWGELLLPIATVEGDARVLVDVYCARRRASSVQAYDYFVLPNLDVRVLLRSMHQPSPPATQAVGEREEFGAPGSHKQKPSDRSAWGVTDERC